MSRPYKKWTKEEIQKIIDLYCKGYKYTDIAKMFKVSKQSIWSVIQRRKREV
jgi:Mor family transcriptional regulator